MQKMHAPRRALRPSALLLAISMSLAADWAVAQATSGTLTGAAQAGSTVTAINQDSGLRRTLSVGADGRYKFASLPTGRYTVELDGDSGNARHDVDVTTGAVAQVDFGAADAQSLDVIQVTSQSLNAIDVNTVASVTSFTANQLKTLPVPHDIGRVAMLAPGTVATDERIVSTGGQFIPSFGGASAAENSYYVNGFNVTNQFDALGYSEVPFPAIASLDLQEGGYGAQYGYSTGGVLNVNTMRGSNEWKGGASLLWKPAALAETSPNIYRKNGVLYHTNDRNKGSDKTLAAWIGGPLIPDTLFGYVIVQQDRNNSDYYATQPLANAGATHTSKKSPYWLAKLDWNINDSNILEYTGFNDTQKVDTDVYDTVYAQDGSVTRDNYYGTVHAKNGGQLNILKYTSYLTDDLTLSAQYGRMVYRRNNSAVSKDGVVFNYNGVVGDLDQPGCPYISDGRDDVLDGSVDPYPTCGFISATPEGYLRMAKGQDTKKQANIDLEWKLGAHDLKAGFTQTKFKSETGQSVEGGVGWLYQTDEELGDFVREYVFQTGASVGIDQRAFYLEDSWRINDRFLLSLGVRNDSFDNKNGLGKSYIKQDNIWQPRLGFSWDIAGDSSMKLYGTAGRYSLPVAANVALRGASAAIFRYHDYFYDGVDPVTGAPRNLRPGEGLPFEDVYYVNGETGNTPDPRSVADRSLKPYMQDEFTLGFQKEINGWTLGAKGVHRKLVNAIDDTCDWRPFQRWGQAHGMDVGDAPPDTMPGCFMFNPGRGLDINIDLTGDGTLTPVHLSAADLGMPKAKRTYDAVQFTFERAWDRTWYLSGSYTWSKNKGNTEGLVKSDIGQTDTGTTQDFDFPELMEHAYGYLPNDRRHSFKAYGAFKPMEDLTFGSTFTLQSGRPENCIGVHPVNDPGGYQNSYFYCEGKAVPRGSVGRTPWTWSLGANLAYQPSSVQGLRVQFDVLNLFNNSKPTVVREVGETGNGGSVRNTTYLIPRQFQTPRSARLEVQYDFTL